ncbi:hypothetical protein BURK2_01268 [Burkholderiales bacterium]|nr:MAG: putative toxin-antitoxin system toxin component, PIN family [Burkholderiales bacterium]CAG0970698.1 hypothetical protein BURK2_01268 [Burkholderiales bacterium]
MLRRSFASKRIAIIGKTPRQLLADYVEAVEVVEQTEVPRVVPGDPDDDQVIAAAVAAIADQIVSGEADLLAIGSHRGIPILTAAQALQQFDG